MTLTSRSPMWVMMGQHKTSDQYLTPGKVSTRSIDGFKRYRLLKIVTKHFNILINADADVNAGADAVVTAIALSILMYRRAKKLPMNRRVMFSGNFCKSIVCASLVAEALRYRIRDLSGLHSHTKNVRFIRFVHSWRNEKFSLRGDFYY